MEIWTAVDSDHWTPQADIEPLVALDGGLLGFIQRHLEKNSVHHFVVFDGDEERTLAALAHKMFGAESRDSLQRLLRCVVKELPIASRKNVFATYVRHDDPVYAKGFRHRPAICFNFSPQRE